MSQDELKFEINLYHRIRHCLYLYMLYPETNECESVPLKHRNNFRMCLLTVLETCF